MQLPEEVKVLIASAVAFVVTQGLKSLSAQLGKDLSGSAAFITASLVGALVVFSEALLNAIPVEYQAPTASFFGLLVALLGAFGIHKTIKG